MARRTRTSKTFKTRLAPKFPVSAFAAVSLTLAALFLLMTPLIQRGARVALPAAGESAPASLLATSTLAIRKDGSFSLDGRSVQEAELPDALGQLARMQAPPVLKVRGDQNLPYRRIKVALDTARAAGLKDLRLEVGASGSAPSVTP